MCRLTRGKSRQWMRIIRLVVLGLVLTNVPSQSQIDRDSIHNFLMSNFNFTPANIAALDRGKIATELVHTDNLAELAVCGAVHLSVPLEFVVAQYRDVKTFNEGSVFPEIGVIHVPPRLDDLDGLTLEEEDMKALQDCKSGDCKVKLSKAMMQRFHTEIDWNKPDYRSHVLGLTKSMLLEFVKSYLIEGNGAMGEYDDQVPPLNKADEYKDVLREKPNLFLYDSALFRYLDQYPNAPLTKAEDLIYWQKQVFEKIKPVFSLNHLTVSTPDTNHSTALVASRQIYANHYFEISLTITALMEDEARSGLYVLYLNRSCFDDLLKKGIVDMRPKLREELYKQVQEELRWEKERLESLYRLQKEKYK